MIYLLAIGEVCRVRVATMFDGDETTEHPWALRRMRECGGIEIMHCGEPAESDILLFHLVRHGRISNNLIFWRARAESAAYLSLSEGRLSWGDWCRETVRSFPHYLRARKITIRPYIHPQFLVNAEWRQSSFASINAEAVRQWRIGFLGNRQPPERMERLMQCRKALVGVDRVYWHEYGGWESTGPRGIEPMEYMEVLSDMDFCISPPGWGRSFTHRTIEALARGSIPIIEDPELYGLELRDNDNCIIARPDDWGVAVRRALEMSEAEVRRMRRRVIMLRENYLLLPRAMEHFRSQLFPETNSC
jgi:hypothetical protein